MSIYPAESRCGENAMTHMPISEELEKRVKRLEKETEGLRQTEEALRESEERFRAIATTARDAIVMMDGEGRVSFWNRAAETMFGYSLQEVMGKKVHGLIAPKKYRAAFEAAYERFSKTGKGEAVGGTLELTALRKDGSEFPIELSLSRHRDHSGSLRAKDGRGGEAAR
jgi:PAS domain S-box-containing protein